MISLRLRLVTTKSASVVLTIIEWSHRVRHDPTWINTSVASARLIKREERTWPQTNSWDVKTPSGQSCQCMLQARSQPQIRFELDRDQLIDFKFMSKDRKSDFLQTLQNIDKSTGRSGLVDCQFELSFFSFCPNTGLWKFGFLHFANNR